jgi:hypothetical protein
VNERARSKRAVLGRAFYEPPPGWRVQLYDAAAAPCGCRAGRYAGVPAVPVATERRPGRPGTPGEARRCLACGAAWLLGADGYSPAPGPVRRLGDDVRAAPALRPLWCSPRCGCALDCVTRGVRPPRCLSSDPDPHRSLARVGETLVTVVTVRLSRLAPWLGAAHPRSPAVRRERA